MRIQAALMVAALLLVLVFAVFNWATFSEPAVLNLVFTDVEAPLGVVMLGIVAALTALYILFLVGSRASALVETRRYARQMQEAQRLASQAEESRFTELRTYLEAELADIRALVEREGASVRDRLAEAEASLRTSVDESHNSLVANIGEVGTRITRDAPD